MEPALRTSVTLREELSAVREYLRNETYRYQGWLYWDCAVDPDVEQSIRIPKKLILTFVENAMNHALFQGPEKGKIEVSVHRSTLGLLIMVSDNGKTNNQLPEVEKPGNGTLKLLDEFLKVYNQQSKEHVSYRMLDRCEGEEGRQGTRVLITVKIGDPLRKQA